jgi:hypothetical protein
MLFGASWRKVDFLPFLLFGKNKVYPVKVYIQIALATLMGNLVRIHLILVAALMEATLMPPLF